MDMKESGISSSGALKNEMLENMYNVKKGDIIFTDIGSLVLVKETRARWSYLMNGKMASVRKTNLWELIDTGKLKISYAKGKRYRTKQRRYRTLDIRTVPQVDQTKMFEGFIDFAKPPFNILYCVDNSENISYYKHILQEGGYSFDVNRYKSATEVMIKVVDKNEG